MRGLMLQRSNRPWGAIDCRQPRCPRKISKDRRFCDPASRQVCLCQRSARRPRSTYPGWTDTVRVSCVVSPSRRHRSPVQRAPSIDTRTPGTRANLSHIADITRRARVSPAMNSSPIRDVRTKSRQRLSDLCHMRYLRDFRTRKSCEFPGQPSTRVEQFGTVHEPQARNEFAGCATRGVRYELVRPRAVVRPLNFRHRGRCLR